MRDFSWSKTERQVARTVFERAVEAELAELIAIFKQKAAAIESPADMWELRKYLYETQQDFDRKYDYRYSQLIFVFGILLKEGRIREEDISCFSADKLEAIQRFASYQFEYDQL